MKLFFETYAYKITDVCQALHVTQDDLLSCFSESFRNVNSDKISFSCVGYFYLSAIKDSVFVMPKVFLNEDIVPNETRVFANGKHNGYLPEKVIDVKFGEDCILSKEDCGFIMSVSVWLYQSIKRYAELKGTQDNVLLEDLQRVVTTPGESSETLLDTIVTLIKFYHDHRSLFTFIAVNKQGGSNRVNWRKTISTQTAFLQKGKPIYTTFVNRQKTINFEEDVIVMFLSVMHYLQNTYYFGSIDKSGYELYRPQDIQRLIDTGKGVRVMKNMTRKYYVDELVQLCKLLRLFFEQAYNVTTKRHSPEMTVVKKYENVFENMIDTLIGDDLPKALTYLKNQKDGKNIDHIYHDLSLIHNDNQMNIYYIGDSKYYKEATKLGTNSVAKQFTYAKNVIQYCMNIFNKDADVNSEYNEDEKNIKKNFAYRDELTEGYNITPNFFIHGRVTPEILSEKSKAFSEMTLTYNVNESKDPRMFNYHFPNRLFDRDTLILQTYDINFLYVLSNYVSRRDNESVKRKIREEFRKNIIAYIDTRYNLYRFTELYEENTIKDFIDENFRQVIGKVYSLKTESGEYCLMLALERKTMLALEKETQTHTLDVSKKNTIQLKGKTYKLSDFKLKDGIFPDVFRWFISGPVNNSMQMSTYLPLFDIQAACGDFNLQSGTGFKGWINASDYGKTNDNMFVVKAVGDSMNPDIEDGDYCIFKKYGIGSETFLSKGNIVLFEKSDSNTEPNYVIKKYHHEGKGTEDEKIILHSLNEKYGDIVLKDQNDLNKSNSVKGIYIGKIKCPVDIS